MVVPPKHLLLIVAAIAFFFAFREMGDKTLADELTGEMPLSRAAFRGSMADLETALKHGADPNERGAQRDTPLHWTTGFEAHQRFPHGDHESCAHRLIAAGADVNAVNMSNETPLYRAIWNPRFTAMLLAAGADANRGLHDRTPLISASYLGGPLCGDAIQSMQRLIAAGANVNAQESSGFSALSTAGIYGCPEMVSFLLQSGANPNARTPRGEAVLALLARYEKIAEGGIFTRLDRKTREQNAELIRNAGGRE